MLESMWNQSSTHIIIKYISLIKYPNNQIVYNFIVENIYYIATHKHSCCTLQKCLEEGSPKQRKEILLSLAGISSQLFGDQYGNYAIQYALSLKDDEVNKKIISQYLFEFQKNTSDKISSNVYEKVLEYSDFTTKQYIIKTLCNYDTVKSLLFDTYGNYVLQKTMLAANEPYRSMYIKYISPSIEGLKNVPNGMIIIHKILSNFPELQNCFQRNGSVGQNMLNTNMINNINTNMAMANVNNSPNMNNAINNINNNYMFSMAGNNELNSAFGGGGDRKRNFPNDNKKIGNFGQNNNNKYNNYGIHYKHKTGNNNNNLFYK